MKHSVTKDGAVFLLEIQHRQNATWQGSITWVDRQNKAIFPQRSGINKAYRQRIRSKR